MAHITNGNRFCATYLISPQELIVGYILDPVVDVEELHHAVVPNILAVISSLIPAVWLSDLEQPHT